MDIIANNGKPYISKDDYIKYIQIRSSVENLIYEPSGGVIIDGKDYKDFFVGSCKEEILETIDFLNKIVDILPNENEMY